MRTGQVALFTNDTHVATMHFNGQSTVELD